MKNKLMLALIVFLGVIGLAGCRSTPIQDMENIPVTMVKADYGIEDVEKAIIRAGVKQNWQLATQQPGVIRARLSQQNRVAEVLIAYNLKEYSIRYLDSQNLDYKPGKINKLYNVWVNKLSDAIRIELVSQQ